MAIGQGRVMTFFGLRLPGFNRLPALQAQVRHGPHPVVKIAGSRH